MTQLTIVAHIHANPGKEQLVRAELEKLVPVTRAEAGCVQYDLHQDNDNPTHFLFFENWESREVWQAHMNAPHLAAYLQAVDGAVAEFTVNEMIHIG
ncbi:MAG: antibiotic biosynthesis monooxygenase [Alphaproteobacteria bacterium]|nr:antibiotic biosynthesis monooxygenase [Alphaproteobacteria bacterium]